MLSKYQAHHKIKSIMVHTQQLLDQFQKQTECLLQKAISEWQILPTALLSCSPAPDAWSAAQCLEHLNFYGRHYLPAIENAIQQGKTRGSKPAACFRSGWLGAYFTQLMQPQQDGTLKSKMTSPNNAVPSTQPDPHKMLAEFIDQQEKMLYLLRSAAAVNLNQVRVPTSLSPWIRLKLGDTFGFVIAHNQRHILQAERALSKRHEKPECVDTH